MDREELAQQTERLLSRYHEDGATYDGITGPAGVSYARQMSQLLANWVVGWRNIPQHNAGDCKLCKVNHSVPETARLNAGNYGNMIARTPDGPDPLVQEPGPRRG